MEIRGERVTIRSTTRGDLADVLRLWNDGCVMRWVGFPNGLGYDREAIGKWYERLQREPHRHHFVVFAASVGFCGEVYYAVDREHRRAALDIKFVPEAQGKGLATDALKVLIRHVFETEKDVNVVWAEPSEANSAARQLYRRCGLEPAPRPADFGEGLYWMLSRETRREGDGGRGERR